MKVAKRGLFMFLLAAQTPMAQDTVYFFQQGRVGVSLELSGQVEGGALSLSRCVGQQCELMGSYNTRLPYPDDLSEIGTKALTGAGLFVASFAGMIGTA